MKKPTAESKPPPQEERDDPEPRSLSPEGGEGDDEAATSTDNYESYDENNRSERGGLPWKQREILTFDIPVSEKCDQSKQKIYSINRIIDYGGRRWYEQSNVTD